MGLIPDNDVREFSFKEPILDVYNERLGEVEGSVRLFLPPLGSNQTVNFDLIIDNEVVPSVGTVKYTVLVESPVERAFKLSPHARKISERNKATGQAGGDCLTPRYPSITGTTKLPPGGYKNITETRKVSSSPVHGPLYITVILDIDFDEYDIPPQGDEIRRTRKYHTGRIKIMKQLNGPWAP